ncbi:MAG: cytochrome c biogenesis protein ResB [Acidobacteria bacterium]|nr:cytochrome c biogenesis protein ResB [Acidobacteriota bacterium]
MAEKGKTNQAMLDNVGQTPSSTVRLRPEFSLVDRFFAFLSSMNLAVFLILFVAFLATVGTLVVQRPLAEPDQIEKTYLPATVKLFDLLGFFDVYHSWWFIAVLGLLGLNLIFCTIDLFPRTAEFIKRPKLDAGEHYIEGQPINAKFTTALAGEALDRHIEQAFRHQGFKPVQSSFSDRKVFFAQTGLWWRYTVYIIHVALLVIFAGGIITARFGYSGFVPLVEGEKTDKFLTRLQNGEEPHPFNFEIQCRDTLIEFRKDLPGFIGDPLDLDDIKSVGKVHRWTSHMTVFENGKEAFKYDIYVNDPLNYRGFKIYQASFGITADFKKLTFKTKKVGAPDTEAISFELAPDEKVSIPGTGLTASVKQFIPDPTIDPKTMLPTSQSKSYWDPHYDNPVARLAITRPDGTTYEKWAMYNREAPWSVVDRRNKDSLDDLFTISNINPRYYTGLQVSHSPGYETFVVGGFMICLALILRFYFGHRRFWVMVKKGEKGNQVFVGAHTSRHKSTLERKFAALVAELKDSPAIET